MGLDWADLVVGRDGEVCGAEEELRLSRKLVEFGRAEDLAGGDHCGEADVSHERAPPPTPVPVEAPCETKNDGREDSPGQPIDQHL